MHTHEISIAGNANRSHTNLNVIRYPEVLLIYAEALYKITVATPSNPFDAYPLDLSND